MSESRKIISQKGNSLVTVYYNNHFKKFVCEKLLSTDSEEKYERYCHEIEILKYLKKNDFVINYLDNKKDRRLNTFTCRIITDYYENGNLSTYTNFLLNSNQQYKHSIKYYIKTFISFFAVLQSKGIAHRDIKPENIFITSDGQMKIGDFGSSIFKRENNLHTIQGTAYYLSPELRKGYADYVNRNGGLRIIYCPYKSDVFSLGLVFLSMVRMEMVLEMTEVVSELEENLKNLMFEVTDPVVNEIISLMLKINPNDRPDFIKLYSFTLSLLGEIDSTCIICGFPGDVDTLTCPSCQNFTHKSCLSKKDDFSCHLCLNPLKTRCFTCLNFFESVNSEHQCENCSLLKNAGLVVFEPTSSKPTPPLTYVCKHDRTEIELLGSSQAYRCSRCYRNFCSACKQRSHGDTSCFKAFRPFVFYCKCKMKISQHGLDEIFFLCSNCGFRCMVCFKSLNCDHLMCARSFEIR